MQEQLRYGLKKFLCVEFATCFLSTSKRAKKRGKFKIKNFFQSLESFLHCFSSSSTAVLGADVIRGRRLSRVFLIFLSKIRGADIISGRILLEGMR